MKIKLVIALLIIVVFTSAYYLFFSKSDNEQFVPPDICEGVNIVEEKQTANVLKNSINSFSSTTETILGLSSEGTEQITYRDDNDKISIITQIFYGAAGKSEAEFYYKDDSLSYILKKNFEYTAPIAELTYEDIKLVATKEFLMGKEQNLCEWYLDGEKQLNDADTQDLVNFLISNIKI